MQQLDWLVWGAGSIGERHIQVLQQLGCKRIHVFRQRLLPYRTIDSESVNTMTRWEDVLSIKPFAAIICTPSRMHARQLAQCLESQMHVLVEKPLIASDEESRQLERILLNQPAQSMHVQVAYMLRYHPFVLAVKEMMAANTYGPLLKIITYWGEYLPAWHPWEDYRQSYAAKTELGGGVALTLSHDVDLICHLLNAQPENCHTVKQHFSPLEVQTDSAAEIVMKFESGVVTNTHLNFFEKHPRRYYRFLFEEATVEYDYLENELRTAHQGKISKTSFSGFERNDMFRAQFLDFYKRCNEPNHIASLHHITQALSITKICE
jgi:predicted dehydrogenase